MNQSSSTEPVINKDVDTELTAMQQAVRKRAQDSIVDQQSRPAVPLSRRLLVIGLTLLAMLVFLGLVNFVVTGMHRIMDVWYPGSISDRATHPAPDRPVSNGVDQPFYITVDPPLDSAPPGGGATDSGASASADAHR
jgi:hypothetical protein